MALVFGWMQLAVIPEVTQSYSVPLSVISRPPLIHHQSAWKALALVGAQGSRQQVGEAARQGQFLLPLGSWDEEQLLPNAVLLPLFVSPCTGDISTELWGRRWSLPSARATGGFPARWAGNHTQHFEFLRKKRKFLKGGKTTVRGFAMEMQSYVPWGWWLLASPLSLLASPQRPLDWVPLVLAGQEQTPRRKQGNKGKQKRTI